MHREQFSGVIGRAVVARQPRAQQPPDVVGELASRTTLQVADPLLQQGPHHRIGPGNPPLQVAGREDKGGTLLIEPDRRPEMAPIRLTRGGSRPRHEHLGRAPVGAAQGSQGIDGDRERSVRDLVRALGRGLVDRDAEQGDAVAGRQRGDHHPVLDAQVRHEGAQGIAHRLRMLHQAADQAQRQDRGALADQQPEMRTVRAGHAQGEQPTQSGMRDDARPVVEQARVEPRLPDDRIRIEAETRAGSGRSPWRHRAGCSQAEASARGRPRRLAASEWGCPG